MGTIYNLNSCASTPDSSAKRPSIFRKHAIDVLFGLFILLPLLVIIVVAIAHTSLLVIYKGTPVLFYLVVPAVAIHLAVRVFSRKTAINSLLSLMGVFLCTSIIYFSLGASYFALVFLLIGQGAVAILFLYAVILLPLGAMSAPKQRSYPLSRIPFDLLTYFLLWAFVAIWIKMDDAFYLYTNANVMRQFKLLPNTEGALRHLVNAGSNDILAFLPLYTHESALFFLLTAILLSAMIGSIVLASNSTREN